MTGEYEPRAGDEPGVNWRRSYAMNLHKTFAITHGGEGGDGTIGVASTWRRFARHRWGGEEIKPFMPLRGAVGSASILSLVRYIRLLGGDGVVSATKHAISRH